MRLPITKHQSALIHKRIAALDAAATAVRSAQQHATATESVLLEVVASIAADQGHDELAVENISVEVKNDKHVLVLVEKLQPTGEKADAPASAP